MQKDIILILKKNTLPISGILLLLLVNYILGMTLTEYSQNIILIILIVLLSSGILLYLTFILDFNDIVRHRTYAILSFLDFTIFTYFLYNGFLGSDNAFKLVYTILIFSNIIYVSIKKIFIDTGVIVFTSIVWLTIKLFLIILIIGTLSVAGLGV